ncbi:MAG: SURF1 family protein [Gammaproteobacteria bacterium]
MTKPLQFYFRKQAYLIQFRLGFFLLCAFLFCLCCVLGVWQLHRYAQKKILVTTSQQRLNAAPIPITELSKPNDYQFQTVSVAGNYLNQFTLLVQNRFYHDQVGFEVLTPLKIKGEEKLVLIDRGWIAKPNNSALPKIEPVNSTQHLTGYIKLLNEYQFILGKNILTPEISPLVMQKIDLDEISQVVKQPFYPLMVRLNANAPNGFIRDWTITTMPPERHMAYAVQWFALALVLLIAYFCFCCERRDSKLCK